MKGLSVVVVRALPFAGLSVSARWAVLLVISVFTTTILEWLRVPAALMLGPMLAGILLESGGARVRIPNLLMNFSQAVIGCLVAQALTPEVMSSFARQWPLFVGVVAAIVAASAVLGWGMSMLRILPGTTAVWGLLPGAAAVMMLMADAFGGDTRLVAFMQYLRLVLVVVAASLVARFAAHMPPEALHEMVWFPKIGLPFAQTVALIAFSMLAAFFRKIPAGVFMTAMIFGGFLHLQGHAHIDPPPWLLGLGFAFLGWSTGLRFTRDVLAAAARALPQCIVSILILMIFCGGLAFALVWLLDIDPLTAYLATSPGGLDSIAIIAASTNVDVSFVVTLQTVRFVLILMVGPPLSRYVATRVEKALRIERPAL